MTLDEIDFEKAAFGIEAEIELIQLREFRQTSKYNTYDDGWIMLTVDVAENDKFSKAQENAFHYIQQNISNIIEAMLLKIYDDSTELLKTYGAFDKEFGGFPIVKSKEELKDYIDLMGINILDDEKDGCAYFGLIGGCSWDDEHGFGIMMYKTTVIELGDYHTGSFGSREIRKHNNTYTEEMRLEDEKDEKIRLDNVEKFKREDERLLNKKWWQFWK